MIISRTPLRISFCGGGSDLESYYKTSQGAVISTVINKYIYITVNKKFDEMIRASYSITEFAREPKELKHELIRESLMLLNLDGGIEITSISDIPSSGTGLGSSSSYTVGLLNALYAYKGSQATPEKLAREACKIEIDICQKPIGKQDQYAAAYGNFNFIKFNEDGTVMVDPIICLKETRERLQNNLLMLYTGLTRSADTILVEQKEKTESEREKRQTMALMVEMARLAKKAIENNDLMEFGKLLDDNWQLKKKMASGISNEKIDDWYDTAIKHGAIGGKILGAGGGGFLLVYAPEERHQEIIDSLPELKAIPFEFEHEGSRIIYFGDR
jgi:D-glycero-alpha-D-manno-heptose-7-phosphate kinase